MLLFRAASRKARRRLLRYIESVVATNSREEARELLERSAATKCPTLAYHLTGTKKVQQELEQERREHRITKKNNGWLRQGRKCEARTLVEGRKTEPRDGPVHALSWQVPRLPVPSLMWQVPRLPVGAR